MNAETMRLLASKGMSLDDILEVADAMERKSDPTNAERQARYRARRMISEQEWAGLVGQVIERDGWVCAYCDCNTSLPENGHAIDHVFPLSRGGSNELENLVMSCKSCNSSKGGKILDDEWTPPNCHLQEWLNRGYGK